MSTYVYNHIVQDNGILDSHTLADNSAGSNWYIRTNLDEKDIAHN